MKNFLVVFGTRPEAIKLAPLIIESRNYKNINVSVCVTGQHKEMLTQVLDYFQIKPDHNLKIMTKNQSLNSILAKVIIGVDSVISKGNYDLVIVQGDTSSAFGAGIAAFNNKVRIAHVEAGLRTGDMKSPFPEEANRVLLGCITEFHLAPTLKNNETLINSGVSPKNIHVVGNTVIDALKFTIQKQKINQFKPKEFEFINKYEKLILITAHRRENLGKNLENICESIKILALENKSIVFVYPVHLNPKVRETVFSILNNISNVKLIDPLDYPEFVYLMNKSYLIISDSGGVQEEAPSLNKPVLVIRAETERQEGVDAGTLKLIGTNKNQIISETQNLINNHEKYKTISTSINPYGDGTASKQILEYILNSIN